MDDFIAEFITEAREMLQALECELVAWEREPGDGARLDVIFRFVHTIKGNCGFFDLPRLEALAHAAEDTLSEVRAGKRQPDSRLVDAVLAVIDRIAEMVETIDAGGDIAGGDDGSLIARLSGAEAPIDGPGVAHDQIASGEVTNSRAGESLRTVRLPTNLVDRFMSGISDMILVRNELERQIRELGSNSVIEATFGRLSSILADTQAAMSRVRMQPIGTLFTSYQRPIRDLSGELGKQVEVEIESGEVELDREMIELLRDPLLHILRNAIDHGIEPPEERLSAGKPASGSLRLTARQTGNEIRIAIIDDGRGIDSGKLMQRAIARGILSVEQAESLEPGQRNMLICEPGLSTADEVTNVSGRGVGMDVVRASVERIGGKLEIESTPGAGCRFLLQVPLTLSIVPSIMVRVGVQIFAMPRSYVGEIVRGGETVEAERIGGMRHVEVRERLHPCVGLGKVLGIGEVLEPQQQTLVMIRLIDGSIFALGVDEIIDSGDLVVRPVATQIVETGLYVGVAQLSDGRPALMLDVAGIARDAGLIGDVQGRSRLELDTAAGADGDAELMSVIVAVAQNGVRKAVAMELVERLIEAPASAISLGEGMPSVVLNDEIIPLFGLERAPDASDSVDILVLAKDGKRMAFATAGKVDAADVDPATMTDETGCNMVLLDGQAVELLDFARVRSGMDGTGDTREAATCRIPHDDGWAQKFLRPLVQAAGYEVVEDDNSRVDLEIRFDHDDAPAAGSNLTSQVLVISDKPAGQRARPDAIHRNDSVSLALALRAAGNGRR